LPWKPAEVLTFERERVLAVKSAAQLYSVARRVLQQIPWDFQNEDASSRPTLKTAKDENAVQHYLAEQLRLRAKGRCHIPREAEVAEANKPDIILMGTSNSFQVAIEAKHGGKNWSTATLEHALREQLAEDYLRPANRRNGILVVTNHRKRGWKHPVTRASLSFADMIDYLNGVATAIKRNSVGDVSVCVVGIDALPRVRRRSAKARPSGAPRQGRRKA
jgi:hypothetical protein